MEQAFNQFHLNLIINLAADSYVERSIEGTEEFINTNIVSTYNLQEVACKYWQTLGEDKRSNFSFHHFLTDEVHGGLENTTDCFTETKP